MVSYGVQGSHSDSTPGTSTEPDPDIQSDDEDSLLDESLDASAADDAFGIIGSEQSLEEEEDYDDLDHNFSPDSESFSVNTECLEYRIPGQTPNGGALLQIGPKGCDTLRFFLDMSKLDDLDPSTLSASFQDHNVSDGSIPGMISERQFTERVRRMISGPLCSIMSSPLLSRYYQKCSVLFRSYGG